MRRSFALLVGVAAVFVVAATPVAASPVAPARATLTPGATVPADAVGLSLLQVSSSGLAVTLDPGGSEEHDVVVSNHTANLRLTIKLSATDATGSLGTGAAAWLAFGDDEIQLDPHAATTVPMTVAVPHDTQPGSDLAHVNANIESAVSAADGTPVAGTASQTFPVSISVQGTPTAQIAIADVHRDDQGSRHELDIVLRNFGDQGAHVSGHIRIAGNTPQILPFNADLAASRDTTVGLKWNPPPAGTPSDIAVDLEYGGGNVASWSSQLGGPPTNLLPTSSSSTPTTAATTTTPSTTGASAGAASKPWWKQSWVMVFAILLLLAAGLWFAFEMSRSRHPEWAPDDAHRGMFPPGAFPPGWIPAPSQESIDLAKQLVKLTDVVVQLVAAHRDERDVVDDQVRARSPGRDPADAAWAPRAPSLFDPDPPDDARAGPPALAAVGPPADPPDLVEKQPASERPEPIVAEAPDPAPPTPGAVARPDPVAEVEIEAKPASEPEPPVHDASTSEVVASQSETMIAPASDALVVVPALDAPVAAPVAAPVSAEAELTADAFARTTEWITELLAADAALDAVVVDDDNEADAAEPVGAEVFVLADVIALAGFRTATDDSGEDDSGEEDSGTDTEPNDEAHAAVEPPADDVIDPRAEMMERLLELDHQRRRFRMWMDAEDSGAVVEPPVSGYAYSDDPDSGSS